MAVSRRSASVKAGRSTEPHESLVEADTSDPLREAVLSLDGIGHVFPKGTDRLIALHGINLDIGAGEFVSLVGPSGCGKSTLLKIIAGLLTPTVGTVQFEGSPISGPRDEIGLMFQTPTLFAWRTAIRNITLPLEIRRKAGPDWDRRVTEVIDLVRLNGFEQHYPRELSGGMQQRVALSRLLVSDPHLMLLDEPFGALDEFTREHLNVELARISDHESKTTIFVTHNIAEAVFLSDRVVVMASHPGRILDVIDTQLPRPRLSAVRKSTSYTEIVNQIREALDLS
jgi:NitT/TauT family transport system ATP-binding protein